jgi:hypothetical protein
MDFLDFAEKEIATALGRVVAGSTEESRQRLQAFRSAINAATKALETALTSPPQVDTTELAARLANTAALETETAVERARAEADAVAERGLAEARDAADTLQARLDAEVNEKEALTASLTQAREEIEELRREIGTYEERVDATSRELADVREAHAKVEAAHADAAADREREARARAAAETEVETLRAALEDARAETAEATGALEAALIEKGRLEEAAGAANSQAQAAEAKLNAVTSLFKASATRVKTLERAEEERAATVRDLEEKLANARTLFDEKLVIIKDLHEQLAAGGGAESIADREAATLAAMEDLLASFRALAGATTIAEVLSTLVRSLSKEFSRVALFRVKGNRLEGQEHLGFDSKTDIAKVVVPLGMDSLMTRAASSGSIERLTGSELSDTAHVPLGGSPSCALALPIVVNGETLGIVYADNSGASAPDSPVAHDLKTQFADAVLQHAVALLTRLTSELRILAELRAYAGSLLSEMEQMYLSDVSAGRTGAELQKRLRENLEYARSIYANRIAIECPDAGSLLDDQISTIVETQPDTAFGRDLGKVAGREAAAANQSRRTAS